LLGALRRVAVFRRHQLDLVHESAEQRAQHALRLGRHAQHSLVPIDVLA
jgi:hypothetical protein